MPAYKDSFVPKYDNRYNNQQKIYFSFGAKFEVFGEVRNNTLKNVRIDSCRDNMCNRYNQQKTKNQQSE